MDNTAPTPPVQSVAPQPVPTATPAATPVTPPAKKSTSMAVKLVIIFLLAVICTLLVYILFPKTFIKNSTGNFLAPKQAQNQTESSSNVTVPQTTIMAKTQKIYTDAEILAMADNKYADGNLPLGDGKYVTDAPKKGYIYLCHAQSDPSGGGAQVNGNWISGSVWNYKQKIAVAGSVSWPNATFSNTISGTSRVLAGNDLPLNYTTGKFPIASTDPAYAFDKNPNSIAAQTFSETVTANPQYSDTPYCIGGEVGVMLSGVALFNGFDAGLRDAAAHEVQDSCDGHPQNKGEYHYHSLSSCFKDINEKTVLGYALDGFPITGPFIAQDKYLTTEDLDECHGITSEITVDGKTVTTYHYVMTQDFPYSVSCFRGKASNPSGQSGQPGQTQRQNSQPPQQAGNHPPQPGESPPHEAADACTNKSSGSSCSYTLRGSTVTGVCDAPPDMVLLCVPNN